MSKQHETQEPEAHVTAARRPEAENVARSLDAFRLRKPQAVGDSHVVALQRLVGNAQVSRTVVQREEEEPAAAPAEGGSAPAAAGEEAGAAGGEGGEITAELEESE